MLEMIVLGQIPGTHFQITITWFAALALAGLFWIDWRSQNSVHVVKHTVSRRPQAK